MSAFISLHQTTLYRGKLTPLECSSEDKKRKEEQCELKGREVGVPPYKNTNH